MTKSPTLDILLDRAGLGIGAVAEAAGVSPRHLLYLRQGHIRTPTPRTVAALARVLGVDVVELRRAIATDYRRAHRLTAAEA